MTEKPIPIRGDQIDLEDVIAAAPAYSDELVTLYRGDCLEVLKRLPAAAVDAIVTDPPAGIEFMGKDWDRDRGGRDTWVAWMRDVMREGLRVLRPGGHALVWAIPRTSHWTATAVEDAGFEVRDVITHHFGSGFPKSLDVSKAIDKSTVRDRETAELKFRDFMDDIYRVTAFIREGRDKAGKSNADLDGLFGFVGMAGHWTSSKSQPGVPQWEQWLKLKELLAFGDSMDTEVWRLNGRKGQGPLGIEDTAYAEREITGRHEHAPAAQTWKANYGLDADLQPKEQRDIAATAAAAEWQGWGTALKPASEHWILARRPLSETNVAANVLKHGTGALNIDGCRIGTDAGWSYPNVPGGSEPHHMERGESHGLANEPIRATAGRWPANLALSHSASCADSACADDCPVAELDRQSGELSSGARAAGVRSGIGHHGADGDGGPSLQASTGGASRFFYTAKASPSERNAGLEEVRPAVAVGVGALRDGDRGKTARNVHPTVKSTDLMRWLCRLITPRRGVVLDPFMGSGSTGVAAKLEDFHFIGIEREEEYMEIAKRRLGWAVSEPELFALDDINPAAA